MAGGRGVAWPLRKDDTHKSGSDTVFLASLRPSGVGVGVDSNNAPRGGGLGLVRPEMRWLRGPRAAMGVTVRQSKRFHLTKEIFKT